MAKKILSMILTGVLTIGLCSVPAFAQATETTTIGEMVALDQMNLVSTYDYGDQKFAEVEPNNTHKAANTLRNDYTLSAAVSKSDDDWYVFTLSNSSTISIIATGTASGLKCEILASDAEDVITSTTAQAKGDSYCGELTCNLSAGTYYLLFTSSKDNNIDYTFFFEFASVPAAPTVTATTSTASGKPHLTWKAVDSADTYVVYYSTTKTGTYKKLTETVALSCTHASAEVGEDYYYKVYAVNNIATSKASAVKAVYCDLPAPTISVSNRASDGKPIVSWKAVEGAASYDVYRCGTKKGDYVKMYTADADKLSVTHIGAAAGEDYFYKVVAVHKNSNCNSAMSVAKGVWCDLPAPAVTVTTRASDGKPVITWKAVDDATGYEVYHCGTSNGKYTKIYTAVATKLSVTHIGATAGEDHFYKVRAVYEMNTKCNSSLSTAKGVWCDLPAPTISVSNRASDGKPVISWNAVAGATGYEVYRSNTSDGKFTKMYTAPASKLSVVHIGATTGEDYFYKVRAICEDNPKCNSVLSTAKGVYCDLARPTLQALMLNSEGKPYITWSAVEGADGYKVYCAREGGTYKLLFTADADRLYCTHTSAKVGNEYSYKVVAICNATSKSNSAYSTVISITAE